MSKKKISKKSRFYNRWPKSVQLAVLFSIVFAMVAGLFIYRSFAAVGDELQAKNNPVWGAQMAKRFKLSPGGGWGFTMDIFGGLHPFHIYGAQPVKPTGGPYWKDFPIARDFVVTKWDPANPQGYVLDGYGGLHPFGGAPATKDGPYWKNWDIARRVVIRSDKKGGYVMDGFGALHPFAIGSNSAPPAIKGPYFNNQDIARDVILSPDNNKGHILDCHGGITPFWVKNTPAIGYVNGYPYDAKRCDYEAFASVEWTKPSGYVISTNGNFAGYGTNGWPGFIDPGLGKVIDAESAVVAGTLRFWLMGANGSIRAFSAPGKPLFTDKEQAFFKEITRQQEEAARKAAEEAARKAQSSSGSGSSSGGSKSSSSPSTLPTPRAATPQEICNILKNAHGILWANINNLDTQYYWLNFKPQRLIELRKNAWYWLDSFRQVHVAQCGKIDPRAAEGPYKQAKNAIQAYGYELIKIFNGR